MTTLILNAVEGRVQFVMARDGEMLLHEDMTAPSRGTELLPPAIDEALWRLELVPSDIDGVACVHGPGSFTGIRLVLAFAAAFRRGTGCRLAPINALQALAASVPALTAIPGTPSLCRVITHARRNLVHIQDFRFTDTLPEACGLHAAPTMLELDEVLDGLTAPTLLLGSGLDRNREALAPRLAGTQALPLYDCCHPAPRALMRLAEAAPWGEVDLEPLYLRPCDAVDNLPHIARKRGESPESAQRKLSHLLEKAPGPEA